MMFDLLLAIAGNPLGGLMAGVLIFSLGMYPVGIMLGSPCCTCCQPGCKNCQTGTLPETLTVTFDNFPDRIRIDDLVIFAFDSCTGYGALAKVTQPGGDISDAGPIAALEVTDPGHDYAVLGRTEPQVVLGDTGSGTGAAVSITLTTSPNYCDLPAWGVEAVTIDEPGTGYTYGQTVPFVPAPAPDPNPSGAVNKAGYEGSGTIRTIVQEPTITLAPEPGTSGTGAAFTVSLTLGTAGNPDFYRISGVTVTAAGQGYVDNTKLVATPDGTGTEHDPASLFLRTGREQPVIELTTGLFSNATGYDIAPVLTERQDAYDDNRPYWAITSINIANGGSGFQEGEAILVAPLAPGVTEAQGFYGYARTINTIPTLEVFPIAENGSGGALAATLAQQTAPDGSLFWRIVNIAVTAPGQGYAPGGSVGVQLTTGTAITPLQASVDVDASGAITGVTIQTPGDYAVVGVLQSVDIAQEGGFFMDTGAVESVTIESGGAYYDDTGAIDSIDVVEPGEYWKEDPSLSPIVMPVEAVIWSQLDPSAGANAVLSATIDENPASETFGQIVGATIVDPGDGYLGWAWRYNQCCGAFWNNKAVVVSRATPHSSDSCVYSASLCTVGSPTTAPGLVQVVTKKSPDPWLVNVLPNGNALCKATLESPQPIEDCDNIFFTATDTEGRTATVTAGGQMPPSNSEGSCFLCCKGAGDLPQEVVATFTAIAPEFAAYNGDYVLPLIAADCNQQGEYNQCVAKWTITPPGTSTAGEICYISAQLRSCSRHESTEFQPLVEYNPAADRYVSCDDCHKKCYTEIVFGVSRPVFASGGPLFCSTWSHRVGDWLDPNVPRFGYLFETCDQVCQPTPQCRPAAGSYQVRNLTAYGQAYTNTIVGTIEIS